MRYCSIESCTNLYNSKGYCKKHYDSFLNHGDPDAYSSNAHGMSKSPEYGSYMAMKSRCLNPKTIGYEHYGGRGIKICNHWLGRDGFLNFLEDMGRRPIGKTLDRRDNNKDYSADNCRWATKHEQATNMSKNHVVPGVHKSFNKWVVTLDMNRVRVYSESFDTYEKAVFARKQAEHHYLGWH